MNYEIIHRCICFYCYTFTYVIIDNIGPWLQSSFSSEERHIAIRSGCRGIMNMGFSSEPWIELYWYCAFWCTSFGQPKMFNLKFFGHQFKAFKKSTSLFLFITPFVLCFFNLFSTFLNFYFLNFFQLCSVSGTISTY